jgi:hypothetical protein
MFDGSDASSHLWVQEGQTAKIDLVASPGNYVISHQRAPHSVAVDELKLYPPVLNFRLVQVRAKVEWYAARQLVFYKPSRSRAQVPSCNFQPESLRHFVKHQWRAGAEKRSPTRAQPAHRVSNAFH